MNELRAGIDAVLAEDPSTLTGPERADRLVELERAMAKLMAAQLATLAVFDAQGDYIDEGAANAAVWLRHRCRLTPGDASSRVRVARRLRDQLDGTREALAAGDVTYQQARVIAEQGGRVADRLGEPGLVALKEAEPIFLTAAQKLHPNDLGKVVRRWEHVVDADGFLSDHERRYERRFLNLSQGFGGMWHIDGLLDPESGATLHAALQPLASPACKDDARNPGQRRADGLVELARRVLDSGTLPQTGGEKPHLTVEVTLLAWPASPPLGKNKSSARGGDAGPLGNQRVCAAAGRIGREGELRVPEPQARAGPLESLNRLMRPRLLLCRRHHRLVHEGAKALPQPP